MCFHRAYFKVETKEETLQDWPDAQPDSMADEAIVATCLCGGDYRLKFYGGDYRSV